MFLQRAFPIALLVGLSAFAADHVTLSNGDSITGTIVKKDGDKLTIKSDLLGEVSMAWSAVKSIKSDSEVTVVLPTGESVKGKIDTTGDQLQVLAGGQTKSAPIAGVNAVRNEAEQRAYERLQHPGLLELWTGNFDFRLALARGNARSDAFTTAFAANRTTRTDKIALYFNQIRASARVNGVTATTASALRGGWKYNRNFDGRMFVTVFNDFEHDRFQDLDLRYVAGAGLGVRAAKSDRTQLDFDAGADYQRENFIAGLHRNSAEFNTGDNLVFKLSKYTTLTQSARGFVKISGGGGYRMNFDFGSTTQIRRWLGLNTTVIDRFLSNPVAGNQRNDLLLSAGFRFLFAR